jgi:hypothetical protein
MGLDIVEMVMDVEERFGISIPDSEAAGARTVGDLSDLVERFLAGMPQAAVSSMCLTSMAFFRLRRGLVESCGVARKSIRPEARLEELISIEGRRSAWNTLANSLSFKLPQAYRSWRCWLVGWIFVAATIAYGWTQVDGPLGLALMPWLSIAIAIGGFVAYERLTRRYEVFFSSKLLTCGDLARDVAMRNVGKLKADGAAIRGEEIWRIVVHTVADWAGADTREIGRETRFVEDLAMD